MMTMREKFATFACALLGLSLGGAGMAGDVPAVLPRPDAAPPADGKVKVYILAGQSNMVGFGYLEGSRPVYPSIYLSADPNIKVGRMPVGPSALLRHGVYQTADKDASRGAKVAIYSGAYKTGTDYGVMTPVKETPLAWARWTPNYRPWMALTRWWRRPSSMFP